MRRAVQRSAASRRLCGACPGQVEDGRKPPGLFVWIYARRVAEMKAPDPSYLSAAFTEPINHTSISGQPMVRNNLADFFLTAKCIYFGIATRQTRSVDAVGSTHSALRAPGQASTTLSCRPTLIATKSSASP